MLAEPPREDACDLSEPFSRIAELIDGSHTIAISGHTSPDGDALGSVLGLGLALRSRYPEKEIAFLLADDAPVPRIYRFLSGADELKSAVSYAVDPDLFIAVDCPVLDRLADAAVVAQRAHHVVAFDHHPCRHEFAEVVARHVKCAATAVLIDKFLAFCEIEVDPGMATALLCGIVTDTGRFQYQNADPVAFAVAAHLVSCGADPAKISLEVYQSQRIEYLRLESLVMGRIKTVADGRVAYSYARVEDIARRRVSQDECDGLVDVVRSVQGVEVCLFLKEFEPGRIRGNLRSKGDIDVSGVAASFGGGGHVAAAGFTFEGSVEDALSVALPQLAALVGVDPSSIQIKL